MYTKEQIEKGMLSSPQIETPLRKWQRRLEVALTSEAKQKARAKIREYSREYNVKTGKHK